MSAKAKATSKTYCGQLVFGWFGRKTQFCALIEKAQSKPHRGLGLLFLRTWADCCLGEKNQFSQFQLDRCMEELDVDPKQRGESTTEGLQSLDFNPTVGFRPDGSRILLNFNSFVNRTGPEWSDPPTIEVVLTPKEGSKIFSIQSFTFFFFFFLASLTCLPPLDYIQSLYL